MLSRLGIECALKRKNRNQKILFFLVLVSIFGTTLQEINHYDREVLEELSSNEEWETLFPYGYVASTAENCDNLHKQDSIYILCVKVNQIYFISHIHAYNKKITSIPASFGKLTQLTSLQLYFNKLSTLPDLSSSSISSLDLGYNSFSTFPESVFSLKKLTSLSMPQNKLTIVTNVDLTSPLEVIDLSSNLLTFVPSGLFSLTGLTSMFFFKIPEIF
eukprot:TRINITY_DN2897_c1_g2_i1.p1 TRINITY_DN2897_c1_g2~~TRINITY_DN2897_c1_g2_i1.p1  ORF type:complete len:217 (-),score=22.56 TRINITY_DN2897_c1_g2_i1:78-728(-)